MAERRHLPDSEPEREVSRLYRRWAFESAALDLALRQATDRARRGARPRAAAGQLRLLDAPLGRAKEQPSTIETLRRKLDPYPDLRFKLDPTNDWDDELIAELVATGAVDSLDLKGFYKGTPVDVETDPELYSKLIEAFPDAWLEDPDVNDETRPILEPIRDRVTWDAPIHSIADIEALPWKPPKMVNIKPSRVGRPARPLRHLRLLRRARHRRLRRWPVGARCRPRADPGASPRSFTPTRRTTPRHGAYNEADPTARAADEPARAEARRRPGSAGTPDRKEHDMAKKRKGFADALNEQIANELAASQQYVGAAVYYDADTLPRLAASSTGRRSRSASTR